jgi:hypothetical protein
MTLVGASSQVGMAMTLSSAQHVTIQFTSESEIISTVIVLLYSSPTLETP